MNTADESQPPHAIPATNAGCNPFVGARPFLTPPLDSQLFCDRRSDRETIQALIAANRAVILHGGAGIGKTSLLHAALLPDLAVAGCKLLELPVGWSDEQLLAWFAQVQPAAYAAPCVLVVDPADEIAADGTICLRRCLDLLSAAPLLRILFCVRSAAAATLAHTLQTAGVATGQYGLSALPPALLAPALAATLGRIQSRVTGNGARVAAAQLVDALRLPADDRLVEPALLQISGRALWPRLDDTPAGLNQRVDDVLAEHCMLSIDAALARHPGLTSAHELAAWTTRHLALDAAAQTLVHRGATESAGLSNALIDALEDGWLLRTYARGGSCWVGLLDPRLAAPLQQTFARLAAATPLAHAATLWANSGRDPRFLLGGVQMQDAVAELSAQPARYGALERELLAASTITLAGLGSPNAATTPPLDIYARRMAIFATVISCVLLVLALWALAAARGAQREQNIAQAQLTTQKDALAVSAAQVEQLRQELGRAEAEAVVAAAQRQRNEQLGRALRAGQLAGAALLRREDAPTQALLYAIEALRVQQQSGESSVAEAVQGLRDLLTTLGGQPFAVASDDISALALSADGEVVAAGDMAGGLHLWRTASGERAHLAAAHAGPIWALDWLPDQRLVTVGADGVAQTWETSSGDGAPLLTPLATADLSTADLYALDIVPGGARLAAGDASGVVHLWNPDEPAQVKSIAQHASAVNVVRFAPEGGALASGSLDGQVRLWQPNAATADEVTRHAGAVNALAFSPDGRWLVSAGADGSLMLYDRAGPAITALTPHASAVNSVAFSADSRWLASGDDDGLVRLWSLADPRNAIILRGHRNSVRSLGFLATAAGPRLLTISYDRTARLWDYLNPEANPDVLRGHDDSLTQLALAGNRFVTAAYDRTVRLWDANDPFAQPDQVLDAHHPQGELALAPDGRYLVASSLTRPYAEVWDVGSGRPLYRREGHNGALAALAVSPDSALFFTGGRDGRVRVWQTDGAAPGPVGPTLSGHVGPVNSLAVHPEGLLLASGGDDTTVRLWDIATGEPRQALSGHDAAVMGVAFSPAGDVLASVDRAGVLLLHDAATGAIQHSLTSDGAGFLAVAFRPDGRWLAAAAEDGAIWIWDLAALALGPTTLRRHATEVNALAFSPASDLLASVDADGLLYLWDLTRLSSPPLAVRAHPASGNAVAFAGDSASLYTAGADGTIRRWTVQLDELIAVACATAGRNLTTAEWEQVFDTAPYRPTCPELDARE